MDWTHCGISPQFFLAVECPQRHIQVIYYFRIYFPNAFEGDQIEKNMEEIHSEWAGAGVLPFRVVRDQAANGKKGVRQWFAPNPPRVEYDGNDCICHILDRLTKTAISSSELGPVLEKFHKAIAYFKKSTKASKALIDEQKALLRVDPNYFQVRLTELNWNLATSWI